MTTPIITAKDFTNMVLNWSDSELLSAYALLEKRMKEVEEMKSIEIGVRKQLTEDLKWRKSVLVEVIDNRGLIKPDDFNRGVEDLFNKLVNVD